MQNKTFAPPKKLSSKSFTLIELIVVIIIVGILAAVGITQYSKTVEKGRGAEARVIFGQIRKLAYEYRLQNGTVNGMTENDVGIGAAAGQIPIFANCQATHYFTYSLHYVTDPNFSIRAMRCTSGGKSPTGTAYQLWWVLDLENDTIEWKSWWPETGSYRPGW